MQELKIAAIFGAILVAATANAVTMAALLLQFLTPGDQAVAWRSLVIALGGVGIALCLICLLHLSLVTGGLIARSAEDRGVRAWLAKWAAVADGEPTPAVLPRERSAASEAAALIMQDISGEGAARIRAALGASGLLARDMALASRRRGLMKLQRVAALERLAWLATPEALPEFHRAACSHDPRAARAGLLGACRALAAAAQPEDVGHQVVACIDGNAAAAGYSTGNRPFLSAALTEAGRHTGWLCNELLSLTLPEAVRAAALDALGVAQPENAVELVTEELASDPEGETLAAALRALARLGFVPDGALELVVSASRDAYEGARVQAAHALVGAPPELAASCLWEMLGDRGFDVRLAAATALTKCGAAGSEALRRAAASHPDGFARDMATMIGSGQGAPLSAAPSWTQTLLEPPSAQALALAKA